MWTVEAPKRAFKNLDRVSDEGKSNWTQFRRNIERSQNDPRKAAARVGVVEGHARMEYKCIDDEAGRFRIRLDHDNWATFTVVEHDDGGEVAVIGVGGRA